MIADFPDNNIPSHNPINTSMSQAVQCRLPRFPLVPVAGLSYARKWTFNASLFNDVELSVMN
jgi:hypothetical protein